MRRKAVIKMRMSDKTPTQCYCFSGQSSRRKALRIAVEFPGVESVAVTDAPRKHLEVMGDGFDPVQLVTLLRKKVGHAELVSVSNHNSNARAPPRKASFPVGRRHTEPSCSIM